MQTTFGGDSLLLAHVKKMMSLFIICPQAEAFIKLPHVEIASLSERAILSGHLKRGEGSTVILAARDLQ